MTRRGIIMASVALLVGFLPGCGHAPEDTGPRLGTKPASAPTREYRLAVHPLHNPAELMTAYLPLLDYVNANIGDAHFTLEASRDYAEFEKKYKDREPDFLLPNPWQTLQAMKLGYHVIAMAGDPADFKGIFVTRRDSGLRHPTDLKGKAVSYPSATALAACIMPQYFLHKSGVNVNKDIENRYVGSQESSIMNAYLKLTAVGATWPSPWRAFQRQHPREASDLHVIWQTETLINNSVMARNDVPQQVEDRFREMLIGLSTSTTGKSILMGMETDRFLTASDADYDVVRRYVARFEREVRPVESRR